MSDSDDFIESPPLSDHTKKPVSAADQQPTSSDPLWVILNSYYFSPFCTQIDSFTPYTDSHSVWLLIYVVFGISANSLAGVLT